ncbi:ATP/GTP-binding protein [Ruegeria sp. HKCCD8929]|uniref:AAA family ATPase n=1 Tax=Ruegeria sp. HKCCD8929 TaxID=2683006 RepID=UPI0014894CB7|nr:ATP-binding protein [Ruegeria sp. HKCCD8929]
MLFKVEIENFLSIAEPVLIDLRARKGMDDVLGRLSPIYKGSDERAPNVVALFGPNAAGKTNVLRSITFAAWFTTSSFDWQPHAPLPYEKFGSKEKIGEPTRLAFSFAGFVDFSNPTEDGAQCPYTYEVVLGPRRTSEGDGLEDEVLVEKISYQPKGRGKPMTILERRGREIAKSASGLIDKGTRTALESVLHPRASIVSTLARLNNPVAKNFVASVSAIYSDIFIEKVLIDDREVAKFYHQQPGAFELLKDVSGRIDLGIEDIKVVEYLDDLSLHFQHSGLDQIIPLRRESEGTKNFVKVFPHIVQALAIGGIAIIDELDTTIHPILLPEILRWFGDDKRNPNGAQLWMTCHSASLLSELTKEEVLFCEKDQTGNTTVFKLSEIEGVRRTENFYGKYMSGEYGAVPVIG